MGIKNLKILFILALIGLLIFSCEDTKDDEDNELPLPVITSIEPVAGYPGEEVTVTGENFNPVAALNLLHLTEGTVTLATITPNTATETQLTFTRPADVSGVGETINAMLAVQNLADTDEKISESVAIDILPIFDIIGVTGMINAYDQPRTKGGIAFDAAGNMYVRGQDPGKITKITPDGTQTYFGETQWGEGEMMCDASYLYAAQVWGDDGTTWRIPLTGGAAEEYISGADALYPFNLDFDDDGNFYIGSADGIIFRKSAANGSITTLIDGLGWGAPMRVHDSDIYWYTRNDSANNGLWKAPIPADGDTIATGDVTQILSSQDYSPSGLAIDGLGDVYLMDGWVDKNDYSLPGMLVRVTPAGVVEEVFELPTQNPNFATWHDNKLYITAGALDSTVYVLHMGEERGSYASP